MAKKLTPKTLVTRLLDRFTYDEMSEATGYSKRQLQRIKRGETSGANAEPVLREFFDLGKRAQAKAVKGEHKIEKRRERPKKETKEEAPPPDVAAEEIEAPEQGPITVDFWGEMGPYEMEDDDDSYVRDRNIVTTLYGGVAAEFKTLWESGDKFAALELATQNYFDTEHGIGPGYLKSHEQRPHINWGV